MERHTPRPLLLRSSKLFQRVSAVLLIIAATLVVYWPALRNGFVWDDTALVLRDPLIRSWRLIPEGFRHFLFLDATASNFYRPLQRLTFTFDYALYAFNPSGWHFSSIAVHAATAVALFFLLRRWWGAERWKWAFGVALVWVVHPLHTSAVTYVAGRADPLAALFGFAGLALALRDTRGAMLGAAACFLGALLSKESGAMALAIWFVIVASRRAVKAVWIRWGFLAALILAAYFTLRFTAWKTPPPPAAESTTLAQRPVLAARAVAEYCGLLAAPVTLRMERDVRDRPTVGRAELPTPSRSGQTVIGFALILGLVAWWWWARRNAPHAAAALLAAGMAYLPVSNLFTLNATVAEHWLYVPSAFLFAASAQTLLLARGWMVKSAVAAISLWTVWLCSHTWQRQYDWADQRTFLTRTIEAGGDSARMRVNLGNLELSEGKPERALAEYDSALARDPRLVFAHFGRAAAYVRLGDTTNARAALERCGTGHLLEAEITQMKAVLDSAEKKK
jgi:hypothetical protein